MAWTKLVNGTWQNNSNTNQVISDTEYQKMYGTQPTTTTTTPTSTKPVYPENTTLTGGIASATPDASFKTKEDIASAAQNAYNQSKQALEGVTAANALQPKTATDYPLSVGIATPQSYIDVQQSAQKEYQKSLSNDYMKQIESLNQAARQNLGNYLNAGKSTEMTGMQGLAGQMANQNLLQQQGLSSQIANAGNMSAEQLSALQQLQGLSPDKLQQLSNQMVDAGNQTAQQQLLTQKYNNLNTSALQQAQNQILMAGQATSRQDNAEQQLQGLNTNQLQQVYNQTLGASGANQLQNLLQNSISSTLNPSADVLANALYQKTASPLQQEFERLRQSTQSSMAGRGLGASTIVEGALAEPTRDYLSQLQQASLGSQIQAQQFAEQQRQASLSSGLSLAGQLSSQQLQALQQAGALAGTTAQQELANKQASAEFANQLAAQGLQSATSAGQLASQTAQQQLANTQASSNYQNQLAAQRLQGLQQAGTTTAQAEQQRLANMQATAGMANQLASQRLQGLTSAGSLATQTAQQQLQGLQQSGNLLSTIEQINQQRPVVAQQLINQASALPGLQQTYGQQQLQNSINAQTAMQNVELYNQQAQQEEWYKRIEQMNNQMKMAIASLNQVSLPMTELTANTNAANIANQIATQKENSNLMGNLIALGLGTNQANPYNTIK